MARAEYAPSSSPLSPGGVIAAVAGGSPADQAGLRVGEAVLEVDGAPLTDILDWQWRTDGAHMTLRVRGLDAGCRELTISRRFDEPWGLEFSAPIFDRIRTCRNDCGFCFMKQLPAGMRGALYLRDDDYRLSFLQGNFVTLTNLSDADVSRIAEQHLSPLYVSLHAVDPEVRATLVCAREDRGVERFDQLIDAGIDLHVQIVLVPGVNDGGRLDETLSWLAEREGVVSVGVVPLGYTSHQSRYAVSYEAPAAAAAVIDQVLQWQTQYRASYGTTWVYLADEFYLKAGRAVPEADHYDGFPQYENGIGLVRTFVDGLQAVLAAGDGAATSSALPSTPVVVTGTLFAPVLESLMEEFDLPGRVLAVPNCLFGGNVSVTGLLSGADMANAIKADRASSADPTHYVVPDVAFNAERLALDDMLPSDIEHEARAPVRVVSCDAAGLVTGLAGLAESDDSRTEE